MANFVDIGLCGTLPIFNGDCLDKAIRAGVAFKGQLSNRIQFDRKHFFSNGNPSGFQITQNKHPIMRDGKIIFFNRLDQLKEVKIGQICIEQDVAIIKKERDYDTVDFNRADMPLCEITTDADISHPEDATLLVRELCDTLRYLKISNARPECGEIRMDTNISLTRKADNFAGPRIEVKSI